MKIYIAGKITHDKNYKTKFKKWEKFIKKTGHIPFNPAKLPKGANYEDYMHICFAMIDICDTCFFLTDWQDSSGAKREMKKAKELQKQIIIANTTEPSNYHTQFFMGKNEKTTSRF